MSEESECPCTITNINRMLENFMEVTTLTLSSYGSQSQAPSNLMTEVYWVQIACLGSNHQYSSILVSTHQYSSVLFSTRQYFSVLVSTFRYFSALKLTIVSCCCSLYRDFCFYAADTRQHRDTELDFIRYSWSRTAVRASTTG